MNRILVYSIGSFVLLGVIIFVVVQKTPPAHPTGKVRVIAAENFYGNIAQQIGGDTVEVNSILSDPTADPHLYESDAHDALLVSQADVVIKNGLGYDDFMDKLLSNTTNQTRTVITVKDVLHVQGSNPNPHLWYDIAAMPRVATAIERALAAKDSAHATNYERNLATFTNSLQPILSQIASIKQTYAGQPVAYTERVAGYLLQAAELTVVSPQTFTAAIENGNEPSPSDVLAFENLITNHKIRLLIYNLQATSPTTQHLQDLAQQAGIPTVGVSETLPAGQTYQTWQASQIAAMVKALGQ